MTEPNERIAELETQVVEQEGVIKSAIALVDEKDEALQKAEALVVEYKPTVDIRSYLMETPDDVRARFSEQTIQDLAEGEIAEVNRVRTKAGHAPIKYDEKEMAKKIDETILDLLADRAREAPPVTGPLMRTLKMVKPDGTLVQIPYEDQINNLAGSISDAKERYREKGFKMTDPDLCPSQNCYELSILEGGNFVFRGYCSNDHLTRTEGTQVSQTDIITRTSVHSG